MRILPVIDLRGGQVVRGIAGRREQYRPAQSVIARDASPQGVAEAFSRAFGFREVYVADLDAIAGQEPAWGDYEAITAAGLRLWIDAGVGDADRAQRIASAACGSEHRVIVGLESLCDASALHRIARTISPDRLVFSLDLRDGRPLTNIAAWASAAPIEIAAAAQHAGFGRLIVLDLAHVGVGAGTGTSALCREIHRRWPAIELIGGGGVRGAEDLAQLVDDGLTWALVASALHDGRLSCGDIERWRE